MSSGGEIARAVQILIQAQSYLAHGDAKAADNEIQEVYGELLIYLGRLVRRQAREAKAAAEAFYTILDVVDPPVLSEVLERAPGLRPLYHAKRARNAA